MKKRSEEKVNLKYVYGIALIASVGGFLYGFDVVIISGAILFIDTAFELTTTMKGFVVSSAILGAVSGPIIGLRFADKLGRRKTMMWAAVLFMFSALGSAFALGFWDLCFWRFLGGVATGLAMMTSPIYIAELAPHEYRGALVNINQLSNVIGINIAVIVSYGFSFDGDWRWMFGAEAFPILLLLIGLFFIPESPRWLALNGKGQEALKVLTSVLGPDRAGNEYKDIIESKDQYNSTFTELFQGGTRRILIIAIILMIFSQINGVNMMLLYAPSILSDLGISIGSGAILGSLPIYVFILICTIVAFPLIQKYNRKSLIMTATSFMALGHLLMFGVINSEVDPLYTLIPMLIGTGAFTLGFAPLGWIITSELFHNKVRAKALGIICAILYLASFLIAQFFPAMNEWFELRFGSTAGLYLVFMTVCITCALFTWKFIPETKHLRLEEVDQSY
ncbi:sugar porter family MFS transporter [Membranihabitans marinus]|uniref:sugar porter family MFS transporter n=1 Tax=Membranihabitans marinus TaxID=1227546 RepID=UPI001EFFEA17|nr:sugar porter family MFS transporter [Membranihabitans marinus]